MSETEKLAWGRYCQARWPCKADTCKHDYRPQCPERWELRPDGACGPPRGYTGPCNTPADLSDTTIEEKKHFESGCGAPWPPLPEQCVPNYAAPCPYGWKHENGDCVSY